MLSNKLLPRVLIRVLPVTIAALLAIGLFARWTVDNITLNGHQARLERVAVQSSNAITARLQNIIDTANTLASNDLISNSLVDASEREFYIPTLFQSLRVPGTGHARVTLVDYRGRRIASNTSDITYADAPWLADVMTGRRLVEITADSMIVAIPVSFSDLPEGAIIIEYDDRGLRDLIQLPIQADAYIVKAASGGNVFSSDAAFDQASEGNPDHRANDDWMWTEATIDDFPNLRLVVGDRMTTVLAPIKRGELFLLLAIMLSVAAVVAGIVATAMRVAKPIVQFMAGVERVGSSADLAYRIEPFGSDEFRKLTESFNRMLSQIESTTSSRDYVDSVLNSMSEFLLVVSPDGKVQSGNRALAQTLGRDMEDLLDRDISLLLSGDWDELARHISGDVLSVERVLFAQDNKKIPVLVSVSPLRQNDRDSDNLILVLNDITEQKHINAMLDQHINELERSNVDLEQFAYVASHDLKAPLRAISSLVGWIEEDSAEHMSDTSRDHMNLLRGRIGRLEALLEGLLQYARVGRDKEKIEWIDTQLLVSGVVELLCPPDSIQIKISESLQPFITSSLPLQQVFHNLIGNAIKHHDREDGLILITGRDLGENYEFAVIDDGPGISEEYHARVFQIFQTLRRRDEVEGSGIGLAVVHKLVRCFGGTIDLESKNGERGSTFRFTWKKHESLTERNNAA